MSFSIERPWALYGILVLIPVIIHSCVVFKKNFSTLSKVYKDNKSFNFKNVKKRVVFRTLFRCIAWCSMVLAYAGISWGTVSSPVQKSGSAVSFVFDISYSMTTRDAPNGISRLEAASSYARALLERISGVPVSAVIAKGNGVVAVPLTEDAQAVYTLLETISPSMMSSVGSNLGDGILCALKSFPRSVSKAQVIWLFTDGEETNNSLLNALNTSLRQGVSVVIIGFGSERESEIFAGDGKTSVKTALRSEKIKQAVDSANKRNFGEQGFKFYKGASAKYVEATQIGSAISVLSSMGGQSIGVSESNEEKFSLAYEISSVERHSFFILFALVFFILSFIVGEGRNALAMIDEPAKKNARIAPLIAISSVLFFSCSSEFHESKKILEGAWNWYQKDYNEAIADFSQSLSSAQENGDDLIKQYALFALSATYLMQNENAASLEKLDALSENIPDKIRFAAFYNSGIIAQREGEYEKAAELFKQALLVDGTNINAKINLELSQNQPAQRTKEGEGILTSAEESAEQDSLLEKSVFNRIRENEQRQWKNLQTTSENSSALDY